MKQLEPEAFSALVELEELDFYDNRLKNIGDALDACTKLKYGIACCSLYVTLTIVSVE